MANEITATIALRCKKGTYPPEFFRQIANRKFTQTGTNQSAGVASIGTGAHEAIPVADIGTMGWAFFENTDTTNYVEIGTDTGPGTFRTCIKLLAGEFCLVPLAAAPYAQANTGAVDLYYCVLER